jgi:RNA-directed DNA polymerase
MEQAAGAAYRPNPYTDGQGSVPGTPVLIRYADDFVALCDSREQAYQVKTRLSVWLASKGLAFNEDKTRIVGLAEDFDFGVQRPPLLQRQAADQPSKQVVRRVRERLAAEMVALRGANAAAALRALNPIVRGWSAYYRSVVSTETFQSLDHYVWKLTYKWAVFCHPGKPKRWIVNRYFGQFHPTRQDR